MNARDRRPLFLTRPEAALVRDLLQLLDAPDVPARKRTFAKKLWDKLPHAWIEGREEEKHAWSDQPAKPARRRRAAPPPPPTLSEP